MNTAQYNVAGWARAFLKLSWFGTTAAGALADNLFRRQRDVTTRAAWQQRWARHFLRVLNVEVEFRSTPPARGMLVANHLGYLDMAALAAAGRLVFVSKAEVRRWPLLGRLARCGGTLFVNRARRADVARLAPQFTPVIESGAVLALFPEGTSTGGDRVLPFHSALLAPAAEHGWPVTPAWIGYALDDGSVPDEVCYWRDMTFVPHFLNLLTKRRLRATVVFGEPLRNTDRKALALELHAAVRALREQHQPASAFTAEIPAERPPAVARATAL